LRARSERRRSRLKSGVTRACRYEPQAQRTYEELAEHYQMTGMPARPKQVRANIDYHVGVDWHFYSVPHALRHEQLEARLTQTTVEIFNNANRVWAHRRSRARGLHHSGRAHAERT
jgi:hypothetical protein